MYKAATAGRAEKPRPPSPQKSATDDGNVLLRFQYKGLYPALEEASRTSPAMRSKLEHLVDEVECSVCGGTRLRDDAAAVRLGGLSIDDLCRMPLGRLTAELRSWKLSDTQRKIAGKVTREIRNRVQFLVNVGLEYLTLARPAPSLSGGEMQRIRLAAQVGSGLCGVLYVLDEPTIGLHPRDNHRLLDALKKLRELGNTLLVVEHDREVVRNADELLDFGPAAGRQGGQIVAHGTPDEVARQPSSVTGPYLLRRKGHSRTHQSEDAGGSGQGSGGRAEGTEGYEVRSTEYEIGQASVEPAASERDRGTSPGAYSVLRTPYFPRSLVRSRCSGRLARDRSAPAKQPQGHRCPNSAGNADRGDRGERQREDSLVEDVLYATLARILHRANTTPGAHDAIRGVELINKVIRVDQQALGRSPTSNPATFTGAFDLIRSLYAQLPEAKLRGYSPRRFSFNVAGGRCEKCEGNGQLCIEMHFLPDVWVECDVCRGRRYNPETLAVRYHGQSIADVLDLSCGEAVRLFANLPAIRRPLQTLCDVGLDYLTLGQPAPTLSGGEAKHVKLAAELAQPDTGRTLYLLDEPTTGLHFDDLAKLLDVLNRLVDLGNTVVVIEHNLDVIKTADWVIDLGPEAGEEGGYLVAAGTPEDVAACAAPKSRNRRYRRRKADVGDRAQKPRSAIAPKSRDRWSRPKPAIGDRAENTPAAGRTDPTGAIGDRGFVSHTGKALAPVLAAGPFVFRKPFDFAAHAAARESDLDITEVGREARMPWEADGPRWHTVDRVGAPAILAAGTAAFWPRSSTASSSGPICLPSPTGTSGAWSNPRRRNLRAGSSMRSPAKSGC